MSRFRPRNITIIGLGLIGGSLAGACHRAFPRARIVGVSRSRRAIAKAKRKRWIHEGYRDLNQAFTGKRSRVRGEIVVLCTPVGTLKNFLERLDCLVAPGTIVTDTGSVKGFLVRWADRQDWRRIHFVGAHPMAGSHERGIDHADPRLFDEALTFVTPGKRTSPQALREVRDFWKKIFHRVAVVSPEKHDRITGEVSHLPHLVAAVLVAGVSPRNLRFAAAGFLDTTRVAQGDPGLWIPILRENRKELFRSLVDFEARLRRVKRILKRGDFRSLRRILTRGRTRRRSLE